MIFSPGLGHLNHVAGELGLLGGVFGSLIALPVSALVALCRGASMGVFIFDLEACSVVVVVRLRDFIALPRILPCGGSADRLLLLFALADIIPMRGVLPN